MKGVIPLKECVDYAYLKYLEIEKSPQSFSSLHRYIFLRRLMAENLAIFRELVLSHPRLVGEVYTPHIADAIRHFHLIKKFFPDELGPFVISADDVLKNETIESMRGSSREGIKNRIKKRITEWAVKRYSYLAEKNDQKDILSDSSEPSEILHELKFVITDNERILGIGDQGSDGAEICFGKLNCYFLGIGFNPGYFFPLGLDVGTDNIEKRNDPCYDGLNKERLKGKEYYELMDIVLDSVAELHPALVQFEDYKGPRACTTLNRFCEEHQTVACFNDDSQGTGAVIVAGLLAAERSGVKLKQSTYLFHGAGGAGIGIAQQIEWLIIDRGLTPEEARSRLVMVDSAGVLYSQREVKKRSSREEWKPFQDTYVMREKKEEEIIEFVRSKNPEWRLGDKIDMLDAVECFSTNILIGTSTQPNQFTPDVIKTAYNSNKSVRDGKNRIVVLALSNPTYKCEILTEEESRRYVSAGRSERTEILKKSLTGAIESANGNIIIATGSPFPDVEYHGKTYSTGQSNNLFVFPGLAYGIDFTRATRVTKGMFNNSSLGVALCVTEEELVNSKIYPDVSRFTDVSLKVASMVAVAAIQDQEIRIKKELMELRQMNLSEEELLSRVEELVKNSVWYDQQEFHKRMYNRDIVDRAADFDFDISLCKQVRK